MESIESFLKKNKGRILDELFDLIRIRSVSAQKLNIENMDAAANFISQSLIDAGANHSEVMETEGWPVVYAEKTIDSSKPTILVYGHYDVQPAEPLELWDSDPFEPEIRNGKIYARGADDDKGQLFMQIKAFEYMVSENKLPCNVKFIIEGEEEIGSPSLIKFCSENKELLKADVILVSDTTMFSLESPTITTGLRGLAYFEIELTGQNRDLHSGHYGGAVPNPCNELCAIVTKLIDNEGRITVPGFYDDVLELTVDEREVLNGIPFDEHKFFSEIGIENGRGESGYTVLEQLGVRPCCDVNGIWGGFTEEGGKTVLPAKAFAKISFRLVPDQSWEKVRDSFTKYIKEITPNEFNVEVKFLHGGNPYVLPFDSKELEAANKAMMHTFGKQPVPNRAGGSIPVISEFEEVLNIKTVLMGFGLESDAIHAPNENYPLENFFKGIATIPWFYHYYCNK